MNRKYLSGRCFEYRIKKYLESKGWLAFRTAGSHGVADIIALKEGVTLLVQCKASPIPGISKNDVKKIYSESHRLQIRFLVICRMNGSYNLSFYYAKSTGNLINIEEPLWIS